MNETTTETKTGYQDLRVWQVGVELGELVYAYTEHFPQEEVYGLTRQVRKAAVSIPSYIADGSSRKNFIEYEECLDFALSSLARLDQHIKMSAKLRFPAEEERMQITAKIYALRSMILELIRNFPASRAPRPVSSEESHV